MRSDVLATCVRKAWSHAAAACAAVVLSAAVAQAADKKPAQPQQSEYEILYARYLETARITSAPTATTPRWQDGLFVDPRAHAANDLLTVKVVESINAAGSADSTVNKSNSGVIGLKLFGLESKLPAAADPANLINGTSDTKFKGNGSTSRNGVVTTNITVRVAEVLPNGDLVLEGAREMDINGDRQMLVLTGVVRQSDVTPGNVVLSTSIGQLRVQYFGHGLIKDSLSPGFLVRFLNKIF
jgi:flagellar L-ring protein precursor FlgH